VNFLAVARDDERLEAPDPHRPLAAQDRLVLAGTAQALARVRAAASPDEEVRSDSALPSARSRRL
jgi:K+/H+ antiporter YhaU regulatory subunit KhtT